MVSGAGRSAAIAGVGIADLSARHAYTDEYSDKREPRLPFVCLWSRVLAKGAPFSCLLGKGGADSWLALGEHDAPQDEAAPQQVIAVDGLPQGDDSDQRRA